jgi:hypothetical protein
LRTSLEKGSELPKSKRERKKYNGMPSNLLESAKRPRRRFVGYARSAIVSWPKLPKRLERCVRSWKQSAPRGSGGGCSGVIRRSASDRERRRRRANALYEFEMVLREEGISDFVYDEGEDFFRFPDGRFAFVREWADVDLLLERGYFG